MFGKPENKQAAKADKLLKKVLSRGTSFKGNQGDLELLRSIHAKTYANTKPGDPSFHAYMAAINLANEFAPQALDILELIPFNNQIADLQEEHMPSYPPMSPVTSAFFGGWMVLDARDAISGVTIGELLLQYLQSTRQHEYLQQALAALNASYCSFYEVMEVAPSGVRLWDIAGEGAAQCWNSSGYAGRKGEIWYVRLLPPFVEGSGRHVTVNTPYVFIKSSRETWQSFFRRYAASSANAGGSLRDYLKYGNWLGYWVEFVFQAYVNHTGNMILATGVPDNPASLRHSDPKHKL